MTARVGADHPAHAATGRPDRDRAESVPLRVSAGRTAVPELPSEFTPRPLLRERLDAATAAQVIVISAPAGSGKTLLLADWVRAGGAGDSLDLARPRRQRPPATLVGRGRGAGVAAFGIPRRWPGADRRAGEAAPGCGPRRRTGRCAGRPGPAGARGSRRRPRTDRAGGAARPRPVDPPPACWVEARPGEPDRPADLHPPAPAGGPAARTAGRRPALHSRRHHLTAARGRPAADAGGGGRAARAHGGLGGRTPARRTRPATQR